MNQEKNKMIALFVGFIEENNIKYGLDESVIDDYLDELEYDVNWEHLVQALGCIDQLLADNKGVSRFIATECEFIHIYDGRLFNDSTDMDGVYEDVVKVIEFYNKNKEETIPLTFAFLMNKLGWSKFCILTGTDLYARSEGFTFRDDEVFHIKIGMAKLYNLV